MFRRRPRRGQCTRERTGHGARRRRTRRPPSSRRCASAPPHPQASSRSGQLGTPVSDVQRPAAFANTRPSRGSPGTRARPSSTPLSCRTSRAMSSTSPCHTWSPWRARCQNRGRSGSRTACPSRPIRLRRRDGASHGVAEQHTVARAGATGVIPVVVVAHEPHEADPREDQRCDHRLWPLREPRLAHPPEPELHAARGEGVHGEGRGDRDRRLSRGRKQRALVPSG